jgi:hypothetical protein
MTQNADRPTEFSRKRRREGWLRFSLKALKWISAFAFLIQVSAADAGSEGNILHWRPFQVNKEFALQPGTGKAAMQRKGVDTTFIKAQEPPEIIDELLPGELLQDARSMHRLKRRSDPMLGGFPKHAELFTDFPQDFILMDPLTFKDAGGMDPWTPDLSQGATGHMKDGTKKNILRFSFFNGDMRHPDRDFPAREQGRYSALERLLFSSSGMRDGAALETMGRIFEPRVDLGIEF